MRSERRMNFEKPVKGIRTLHEMSFKKWVEGI